MEEMVVLSMTMSEYRDILAVFEQRERQREAKREHYRSRKEGVVRREPYTKKESTIKVLQVYHPQITYVPQ